MPRAERTLPWIPIPLADGLDLVDEAVSHAGPVVIGGGVRSSTILVVGAELATLSNARVIALAQPKG